MIYYGKLWYYGKKLWYYTENYGISIYVGKNIVDYQKLRNFDIQWKNYGNVQKQFLKKNYTLRTLIYYGKTMVQRKKQWYYEKKNYGAMEKTMILYRKLWNFVIL